MRGDSCQGPRKGLTIEAEAAGQFKEMIYRLNQEQFDRAWTLPGDERYRYFLSKIGDLAEVWTLKGPDGFVFFATDEEGQCKCFPFWPHPDHAAALAVDMWADCEPERIDLYSFLANWLPGMKGDSMKVAVFPTPLGTSIIVEPETLMEDLNGDFTRFK